MSRSVSATFRAAAYARETSQVFLTLLVIDHADLATPIRVVNNNTSVMSGGYTYTPFPFRVDFPQDSPDELPSVQLQIDNVSRDITVAIRTITGRPSATLYVVLASSPDTIDYGPVVCSITNVSVTDTLITAAMGGEDMLNTRYPKDLITPQTLPGLF